MAPQPTPTEDPQRKKGKTQHAKTNKKEVHEKVLELTCSAIVDGNITTQQNSRLWGRTWHRRLQAQSENVLGYPKGFLIRVREGPAQAFNATRQSS